MTKRYVAAAGLMVAILALALSHGAREAGSIAQATATPSGPPPAPSPTPPFSATFVAEAQFAALPAGDAVLSVSTFALPPGTTTKEFSNPGPVLIRIQTGSVSLDAEEALVSQAIPPIGILVPVEAIPGPADDLVVASGQQILLPSGIRAQISNPGTQQATLMVVTLAYSGATSTPTAAISPAASPDATPVA